MGAPNKNSKLIVKNKKNVMTTDKKKEKRP